MIQFNLLPNVKQEYIKTQRTKRLVIGGSLLASAAALFILLLLASTVYLAQRKIINDLTDGITANTNTLKNTPNIADILTVQTQLNSLSSLHASKPVASRLFGYLSQLTPTNATISDLHVDFNQSSLSITGNAPSFDIVNTFVDSLKFTTYSVKGQNGSQPAFSNVLLASFSRDQKSASYTITLTYDQAIFDSANDVTLSVGGQAQAPQQPSIIFKKGS